MNLHPIFIHFPIALLTVYSVLELISFGKIRALPFWFYLKALVLFGGTLGAVAAIVTGTITRDEVLAGKISVLIPNPRAYISVHENWAHISLIIFLLLSAGYFVVWVNQSNFSNYLPGFLQKIWTWGSAFANFLVQTKFVLLLALAGLISITITGSLGGAMVYGPNTDPVVHFVYQLLAPK